MLPMECMFCKKNKYKIILLKNFIKCLDDRVVESTKNTASISDNQSLREGTDDFSRLNCLQR